ncbi:MAG: HU family DNA-binding protein [candidate division WOR-3 bacterium]
MNKQQLINTIASKAGITKKDAGRALDAFITTVKETLKKGDEIRLVGFGTFQVRKRAARPGRNPQTKKPIQIPAKKVPAFRASSELKKIVNK